MAKLKIKQLFVDVETTGLKPSKDLIRQLAFIYRVNGVIKCKGNIKKDIYSTYVDALDHFVDRYNKDDKIYLFGYNISFDADFMRTMFIRNKNEYFGSYFYYPYIDVMQIAAHKFMKSAIHPENFKLATVCKKMRIGIIEDRLHDAEYDIDRTEKLYNKLIKLK